ncbi:MAG: P-loop ATPase, Sll1717 family [Myxococcota bacterium]
MAKLKREEFRFRRHDNIGSAGAEEDAEFLHDCFVDTGDLDTLADTTSAPRIVVGRTGVGKTALLIALHHREEHVSAIEPEQLALDYLANSTILRRLLDLGVDLDIFYQLLWRHVFAVELIQLKYKLSTEADQKRFLQRITERFQRDKTKEDAVDYLRRWGEHFWEDAEYRIHEVTRKLEQEARAAVRGATGILDGEIGASANYSEEEKKEIVHRLQAVVNSTQIRELGKVIDLLATEVFDDQQERFFVTIDRLDERWVGDQLRYRLIRALIETVRDLKKIAAAKVVVAIRRDLLERVFRETRDAGFQEEKYRSLILRLYWRKAQLLEIVDRRINKLVRRQYTKAPVAWTDVFPAKVGKSDSADYLVQRTLYRPRDLIEFVNCCIEVSMDRPEVTVGNLRAGEANYSNLRFRSLGDEWAADYPNLLTFAGILKRRPASFRAEDITQDSVDEVLLSASVDVDSMAQDDLAVWARELYASKLEFDEFRRRLIKVFYTTGLVGLRSSSGSGLSWSFLEKDILREAEIGSEARVEICPMLFRVLGTELRS